MRGVVGVIVASILFLVLWHCPTIPGSELRVCKVVNPPLAAMTDRIDPALRHRLEAHLTPARDIYAAQIARATPHLETAWIHATHDIPFYIRALYHQHIVPLDLGTRAKIAMVHAQILSRELAVKIQLEIQRGIREMGPALRWAQGQFWMTWHRYVWPVWQQVNDKYISKQVNRILDVYASSSVSSSAVSHVATSVSSAVSTISATPSVETVVTSVRPQTTVASKESVSSIETIPSEVSTSSLSSTERPAVETTAQVVTEPASKEPIDWPRRVQRTVESAIKNLEEDGQVILQRTIDEAKPDIMQLLRDISLQGAESAAELELIRARIVDRDEDEDYPKAVYKEFEDRSRQLAEMALLVRDRALELANDALDAVKPVKMVTLDAIDDFFDVVLLEAARQVAAEGDDGDWSDWRAYHELKTDLNRARKRIEDHEFSMDIVNQALKEAQSASVLLVQDCNKHFTSMRAEIQLVFQKRALEAAKEEYGDDDRVEDADYYDATSESNQKVDPSEDTTFDSDEFEDDDEVETVYQTRTSYVTLQQQYD